MPPPRITDSVGGLDDETEGLVAFPILDLPPELVIRIIEHAVITSCKDRPIVIVDDAKGHQEPAMTRVCLLFRSEGLPLFYKHNTFMVATLPEYTLEFFRWIKHIGLQRASTIQSIYLYWDTSRSFGDRTWQCFLGEMSFVVDQAQDVCLEQTLIDQARIRFRGGKVVLGSGSLDRCYELSFAQGIQATKEWRGLAELSELSPASGFLAFDSPKVRCMDKDFWVLNASSTVTAPEEDRKP